MITHHLQCSIFDIRNQCTTLTQQFLRDLKLILKPIAQPCKTIIHICLTKPAPTNTKVRYSLTLSNYIESCTYISTYNCQVFSSKYHDNSDLHILCFTSCTMLYMQCHTSVISNYEMKCNVILHVCIQMCKGYKFLSIST